LVKSAVSLVDGDPFGEDIEVGNYTDDNTGWNIFSSGYTYEVWDIYEGSSQMADGRTWQSTSYVDSSLGFTYLNRGPKTRVPWWQGGVGRINAPCVYERGADNLATCFAIDTVANTAAFFLGRFRGGDALWPVPMYYIPCLLEPAEATGTMLEYYGSDYASLCLASCGKWNESDVLLLPRSYWSSTATGSALEEREATNLYATGLTSAVDIFGIPYIAGLAVANAYNRALKTVINSADLRTYRTAAASATYDWPGIWPTSAVP
jgi:hypothetical protein